ncbi:DUF1434 domain-containing protein [Shewanella hanedai]|nr:DUF1434 domain-containing protein [Shewanella hanedai]
MVVLACLCLTSFLAWPTFDNLFYQLTKAMLFTLMLIFFIYQFRQLNHWKCHFVLNVTGEGALVGGGKFTLCKTSFVSPFVSAFYIQERKGQSLMMVWSDMCDDNNYRHLCRLLLAKKA